MKRVNKGEFGYLRYKKIFQLTLTLIFMIMVAVFFFTGYIRYNSTKTIFTVFAVLSVLPAAKQAVIYMVLIPYKGVTQSDYNEISEIVSDTDIFLVCDMVLTAQEKVSNVDMACVKGGNIVCYITNKKTDKSYTDKYIKGFISPKYKVNSIKSFTDISKFKNAVRELNNVTPSKYDEETSRLLLSYSV